jgi:hypothetical protein
VGTCRRLHQRETNVTLSLKNPHGM